jgi:hypothetical protein
MSVSYLVIDCFSMAVGLGVGILGLLRYRFSKVPIRLLVWYILIWFVVDVVEFVMSKHHINNLWISHCDTLIEVILFIAIVFYWRTSKRMGLVLIVSFSSFVILWIVSKYTFEPMTAGDDITWSFSRLFMICFAGYLMFAILNEQTIDLTKDSRFWVITGFIIYSVGTLLLFSSFNYLISNSPNVLIALYPLNWILTIITHLFFACAIWCQMPQEINNVKKPVSAGTIRQSQTTHKENPN